MQNDVSTMSLIEVINLPSPPPISISTPSPDHDAPEQSPHVQDQKATQGSYLSSCIIIMSFKYSIAPELISEPILDVSMESEPVASTVKKSTMVSLHVHDDIKFCVVSLYVVQRTKKNGIECPLHVHIQSCMQDNVSTISQSEEQDGLAALPSPQSSPTSISMPSPDALMSRHYRIRRQHKVHFQVVLNYYPHA